MKIMSKEYWRQPQPITKKLIIITIILMIVGFIVGYILGGLSLRWFPK